MRMFLLTTFKTKKLKANFKHVQMKRVNFPYVDGAIP